jgi:hypothetical protein
LNITIFSQPRRDNLSKSSDPGVETRLLFKGTSRGAQVFENELCMDSNPGEQIIRCDQIPFCKDGTGGRHWHSYLFLFISSLNYEISHPERLSCIRSCGTVLKRYGKLNENSVIVIWLIILYGLLKMSAVED